MNENDSAKSLLGRKLNAAKSRWFANGADLLVLLASFLFSTASIVLIALIFHTRANFERYGVPYDILSVLQRVISALSTTVTSAVIMVVGKYYVLFKLTRGGMRCRKLAVYTNPFIGNLAIYLASSGLELPLLALTAVWALGLATGLTVHDAWAMVPDVQSLVMQIPFGPFNEQVTSESNFSLASGQLSYVMTSVYAGVTGVSGLIRVTGGTQLTSGGPTGTLFYPPPPNYFPGGAFSSSTALNGFNITMESISSIPSTARSLICVDGTGSSYGTGQLWYEGGDNQTLSIVATIPSSRSLYRFNATAIVVAGTLQSTGSAIMFTSNGTTWPNVMTSDLWARDIASLVCNATTYSIVGGHSGGGSSLLHFAIALNAKYYDLGVIGPHSPTAAGIYWSTALGMAIGAYGSALRPTLDGFVPWMSTMRNDVLLFAPRYGVYVLISNVVVSVVMLAVVVRLRAASRLGADFLNATRLLLDPLKNPELFNASLDATVNALANPYMLVREYEFLLAEHPLSEKRG